METEQKLERLGQLHDDWTACERCGLCSPPKYKRHNVVFGEGNPDAHILIVTPPPGEKDDLTGHPQDPTSGAGEVLNKFLEGLNSDRDEVFITPVVGCRPMKETGYGNRSPSKEELAACRPRLDQIIEVIDPYVVILLGADAFKVLSPEKGAIKKFVENKSGAFDVKAVTQGVFVPVERPAFVAHAPGYLAANWDTRSGGPVHTSFQAWEKAFHLADYTAELFQGIVPPQREKK
jgi:uracil-DNA glycosylase family 4